MRSERNQSPAWESAPDAELVARMLEGDELAWRGFVARFSGLIRGVIRRTLRRASRCVSVCEAEDVYASLMCGLLNRDMHKMRTFDPCRGSHLRSWVAVLAMHAALDHIRSANRASATTVSVDSVEAAVVAQGGDPFEHLSNARDLSLVQTSLKSLSPKDRELLELILVHDQTPEQVAATMNIALGTVYSKKHKIATRLRLITAEGCE